MRRGEVWWVEFDERRPVVLLSDDEPSGFRGDAGRRSSRIPTSPAWESRWQSASLEGLPFEGVLRFAFPWPGFTPCTWLTTLSRDDLIERAGAVSTAKLSEIDDALRASRSKGRSGPRPRRPGSARLRIPSAGRLRQTEKERTPTLTKVDLVRTTDGCGAPATRSLSTAGVLASSVFRLFCLQAGSARPSPYQSGTCRRSCALRAMAAECHETGRVHLSADVPAAG